MTIAVHNVVQLTDDEVRERFVVRRHALDEMVGHLRETDPPRHVLVIGQRGMGKSLLLRRVAVTVTDEPDLAARWLPVMMPEELYEVTSIGELWLAALGRIAAVLDDADLARQHAALRAEPDPGRLEALALQRLLGAGRAHGRKVLLLAENLDMLFDDQVSADGGWALRQALQTEHDLLLMGTAVTTFSQVEEAGEALYGFFHRIDLRPLDDAEVRTLWREVTGVDLVDGRTVPIRILTGGSARLITVLGRFSKHPDLGSLRQDLELLIDEYTPYFKANIEALPAVERKVFVTLADIWAPATAAEVAERARMTSSTVSALLGRLVRRGAVEVVEQDQGKQRYELTERLCNLYHLLRRPDGEGRVRALVDILTHLYDPRRLEREVLPRIVQPAADAERLSDLDTRIASRLERHIYEAGVRVNLSPAEHKQRVPLLRSLVDSQRASLGEDHPDTLTGRHAVAYSIGEAGDARSALDLLRQLALDRERVLGADHADTLTSRRGVAYYTGEVGDVRTALELFRQVAADSERTLGADHPDTLTSRFMLAYYTGETGDSRTGLRMVERVVQKLESLGGHDRLLAAARLCCIRLELKVATRSGRPLARELRQVVEAQGGPHPGES